MQPQAFVNSVRGQLATCQVQTLLLLWQDPSSSINAHQTSVNGVGLHSLDNGAATKNVPATNMHHTAFGWGHPLMCMWSLHVVIAVAFTTCTQHAHRDVGGVTS